MLFVEFRKLIEVIEIRSSTCDFLETCHEGQLNRGSKDGSSSLPPSTELSS